MTKEELIKAMSQKSGLTKKNCEKALNTLTEVITETLAKGEKIQLVGFGSFEVRQRAERKARNPQTRKEIIIPATKVPVFKAGKMLKQAVATK